MNCKKNIPCPKGGMECCMECVLACDTRCEHIKQCKREAFLSNARKFIAATLWWVILFLMFLIIIIRFDHMEKENNAIIDRLDQVENTITEQIETKFPAEEFTDTEEDLGGEFKSWMSFQTNLG